MSFFTFNKSAAFQFSTNRPRLRSYQLRRRLVLCLNEAMRSHLNAPLNRRFALILALLSLWLVGALLLVGWQFVGLDYDANAIFHITLFHLARAKKRREQEADSSFGLIIYGGVFIFKPSSSA